MTYEYKCDRCGEAYYVSGRITQTQPDGFQHKECPDYPQGMFHLLVTGGVGTIFVGGGWTPRSAT